jgi:galactose mutarotase-like enzyme
VFAIDGWRGHRAGQHGDLRLTGADRYQVYAPQGKDYVCFEPMTAPANALRSGDGLRIVNPGELHLTAFTISIGQSA